MGGFGGSVITERLYTYIYIYIDVEQIIKKN